ncbi:MAG TPA: 4Fe-4S dicluster domain-containing protein, partial [Deltaproteobacteria bacterium]|nr:4Fe-4S dicluster domain-containing protein [Deltaproteobacteria bacterium]
MARSQNGTSTRRGHILIQQDICKGCGLCISVCPQHVIE